MAIEKKPNQYRLFSFFFTPLRFIVDILTILKLPKQSNSMRKKRCKNENEPNIEYIIVSSVSANKLDIGVYMNLVGSLAAQAVATALHLL